MGVPRHLAVNEIMMIHVELPTSALTLSFLDIPTMSCFTQDKTTRTSFDKYCADHLQLPALDNWALFFLHGIFNPFAQGSTVAASTCIF